MLQGVDVSHYQASTPDLTGRGFLIAKATQGTGYVDPMYARHVRAARAAGLVTGAYHFGVGGDGAAQARHFLATAGDVDLLALDLELNRSGATMTHDQAAAFITAVKAAGRRCGLYHSLWNYPGLGQSWRWVAYWSTAAPGIPWDIWQYRGSPLDLDRFDGAAAELRELGRGSPSLEGDMLCIVQDIETYPAGRRLGIAAGTTVRGFSPARPGVVVASRTWPDASSMPADAMVSINWPDAASPPIPRGTFWHVTAGFYAGLYVPLHDVTPEPLAPSGPTQAELDAARAAGYLDGLTAADQAIAGLIAATGP